MPANSRSEQKAIFAPKLQCVQRAVTKIAQSQIPRQISPNFRNIVGIFSVESRLAENFIIRNVTLDERGVIVFQAAQEHNLCLVHGRRSGPR
jgi:hypothetical protein